MFHVGAKANSTKVTHSIFSTISSCIVSAPKVPPQAYLCLSAPEATFPLICLSFAYAALLCVFMCLHYNTLWCLLFIVFVFINLPTTNSFLCCCGFVLLFPNCFIFHLSWHIVCWCCANVIIELYFLWNVFFIFLFVAKHAPLCDVMMSGGYALSAHYLS